jgi:GT2 family glycosyltransferase
MSVRVSAIVISHSQPDWLRKTLSALLNQTRPVDEIVAVDTSTDGACLEVFQEFGITKIVRRTDKNFGALVAAGVGQTISGFVTNSTSNELGSAELENLNSAIGWYWLLHDDSVPDSSALANLLAAADLSPSVALLGPKQVDPDSPRRIIQLGITLTKLGGIFSLVDGELDQAQHDSRDDVLAIGTAGALVRSDLYRRLQGFDRHAPNFASDIDFSVRARLSGYRVVVVPSARVAHAALSQNGRRPRRWLGANPETAKRRAEIHLQLAYLPVSVVWAYALWLPMNGLVRALWRLGSKRPNLIFSELSAAAWGFLTLPTRFLSRTKVNLNRDIKFSNLWPLRATASAVRDRNRLLQEHYVEEFVSVSLDSTPGRVSTKKFAASGGWFLFFALLVSSWQLWPTNSAAVGGTLAPLSADWFHLAGRAGSSWQNSGLGLAAPSDPFNWLLAAIGSLWFLNPSIALAVAILLGRSMAFAGAWSAVGLVSKRAWVRNLLALAYALWPSALTSQVEGRIGAIFTWMALPWLVLSVSKLLDNSNSRRVRGRQSTWLGISSILFAVVFLSSSATGLLLILALLLVVAARPGRIGPLAWVPSLAVLLAAPFAWFLTIRLGQPLAILSDPGLPLASGKQDFWQILISNNNADGFDGSQMVAFWPALVGLSAAFAWFANRALIAAALTGFATLGAASGYVLQRIDFASLGVNGSAAAVSAVVALSLLLAAGIALDSVEPKWLAASVGSVALLGAILGSLGAFGITSPISATASSQISFTDGRTVPAIVEAEALQGTQLRLLKIAQTDASSFSSQLVWADGLFLESNSTAYRNALADQLAQSDTYKEVDSLVANLVSANGADLAPALKKSNIGYILVPSKGSVEVTAALNSVSELESVGETEFGYLWSVRDASSAGSQSRGNHTWSITKALQLFGILVCILLALPGGRARRSKGSTEIFGESDFEENETDEPIEVVASTEDGRNR